MTRRRIVAALREFGARLVTPVDCPIHTACVRIGATMVAGIWVMLLIVEISR